MSLELRGIDFSHPSAGPGSGKLLDGLHLGVAAGEITGLGAPSGAGKSTLLRIAALMKPADSGSVLILGRSFDPGSAVPTAVRQSMGVVLQSPRASADPRLRLDALISAPLAFRDGAVRPHPQRYAQELAGLAEMVHLEPALLRHYAHQVSDGQLQRALLARALALDPAVLICDEPTAQLDAVTTAAILGVLTSLAAAGAAVLVASHDHSALSRVAHTMVELKQINGAHNGQTDRSRES